MNPTNTAEEDDDLYLSDQGIEDDLSDGEELVVPFPEHTFSKRFVILSTL